MSMARLIVYRDGVVVREVALAKDPFFIGRALESDLSVMDHLVSRRHGKLTREGGEGWRIVDLGSSNGIFVNDERVNDRALKSGDRLRIGSATIEFRDECPPSPDSALAVTFGPPTEEDTSLSVAKSVADLRRDYAGSTAESGQILQAFHERRTQKPAAKESLHFFILFQLAQAVNSSASLSELFKRTVEMLCDALEAGRSAILLLDHRTGELYPVACHERNARGAGALKLSRTITDRVVKENVAILTRDALVDDRFKAGKSVAALQIRSAICAPIWDADHVDGIVYLDNTRAAGIFSEEDRDLVTAVGHQLAVAIKREEMTERLKREAIVRSNLERYHSPDVVDMILKHEGELALEVKEAEVTCLFADIESFTKLSERLSATEVARMLNSYFEATTAAIFSHKGQVNKYIGDAILAVFGAPIPNPDHAADACRAALAMLEALRQFRSYLPPGEQFRIRIGINSGPVVAGNIGTAQRLEYTVIGNTVNVAARLEKIAPPDGIAIGPEVESRVRGRFITRPIGPVRLKGLDSDLEVFWLEGVAPPVGA